MPAGRPRSVSLPPDQMIQLGKEMIDWVKTHDPLHLSHWYCVEKGYTDAEWRTMHVCPEFFPYYEQAIKIIGLKYLDKESRVREGVSQRFLRLYFKDLKEDEDETARFNAELKKDAIHEMDGKLSSVLTKLDSLTSEKDFDR